MFVIAGHSRRWTEISTAFCCQIISLLFSSSGPHHIFSHPASDKLRNHAVLKLQNTFRTMKCDRTELPFQCVACDEVTVSGTVFAGVIISRV